MPVTDADEREVVALLLRDMYATIGTQYDELARDTATLGQLAASA